MIKAFTSFIEAQDLFSKDDRILLAVSGGMDSMAMLELFHKAGYVFDIIHCNFKLRGADADEDERFVLGMAERYGVKCFHRSFDTAGIAKSSGRSIQMVARELRYEYFDEVVVENGYNFVATAHHLDDQTETFFINLARGCGLAGLHGIAPKKDKLVRPLLFTGREGIETFIKENQIPYREDTSNAEVKYIRNKIRHEILPMFREINPSFDAEMTQNIARLAETESIFKDHIEKVRKALSKAEGDIVSFDIDKLKELNPIDAYLYAFLKEFGFGKDDIMKIIDTFEGISGKQFFSPTHRLLVDRDKILITRLPAGLLNYELTLDSDSRSISEPLEMAFEKLPAMDYNIPQGEDIASLDYDKLRFPLRIRSWKKGDYFIPLGMKNRKKLSDYFIDKKFSRIKKERSLVLISGDDIAWIIGERIDERYKVTADTKLIYRISVSL